MSVVDLVTNYITPFQAALATSVLLFYFVYLFLRDNDLPPGPIGLPILGYWPFLNPETCHIQLAEMIGKYGEIFSFRSTGRLFIHLGSIKAIKEAHLTKSDYFGERFSGYNLLSHGFNDGVILLNGEPWKILRRFFLSKFKEFGMNKVKDSATSCIHDILVGTVNELQMSKGQPIAVSDVAASNCSLVIRRILFNDEGIKTEEMQELIEQYSIVATAMKSTNFLLYGNLAKYVIFPLMPCYWRMRRANNRIDDILKGVLERREKEYDRTEVSDIMACFLKEREDRRQKGDPTANYFSDKALIRTLNQFVTDGVLSVGLFISLLLTSLAEHPEEQDKIYEEVLEVTGPDRFPSLEDKPKLPYTNAFIYEVMRTTDFFPLFTSQQCTRETTIQGHKIPKGAITVINVHAVHRNPTSFEDPNKFNPSRYLASSNKTKAELPVTFGIGKRSCIGEGFAMIQAFLIFTTIVKNFRLSIPEDSKNSSIAFSSQERVIVCAIPRSHKEQS